MSLFTTGDLHGEISIQRLSRRNWPKGHNLTVDDCLIIMGDFGLLFYPVQTKSEKFWLNYLACRRWTTLFVDGNHDNPTLLNDLPREEKFGGIVGKVSDRVYHLRRGEVYNIQDKKILAFGGAMSSDKLQRREGYDWWPEEVPNYADMENCLTNLEKNQNKVDFIVAHTCPSRLVTELAQTKSTNLRFIDEDPTTKMLEHIVSICSFESFYCGHWHIDERFDKYRFLYNDILQIV